MPNRRKCDLPAVPCGEITQAGQPCTLSAAYRVSDGRFVCRPHQTQIAKRAPELTFDKLPVPGKSPSPNRIGRPAVKTPRQKKMYSLPVDVVAAVDARAAQTGQAASAVIEQAVKAGLPQLPQAAAKKEAGKDE